MGLFSDSKKTYVDSSVWNMAGEYDTRFKVLPNIVAGIILGNVSWDFGNRIRSGLMNSSAVSQRRFFRWARANYALGVPTAQISADVRVNSADIRSEMESQIGLGEDQTLQLNVSVIDFPDDDYWAEEYVAQNRSSALSSDWVPYFDPDTSTIRVVFGPGDEETFPAPADFLWGIESKERRILFVNYQVVFRDPVSELVSVGEPQMFTYRMGTGNTVFDALDTGVLDQMDEFYPAIPIRIKNSSVTEHPDFENISKGFKKLSDGRDIGSVIDSIEEHESVGDMDFVNVVFGVALNTEDQSGRSYMYRFFQELLDRQQFKDASKDYNASLVESQVEQNSFVNWVAGNLAYTHPLYAAPAPLSSGGFAPALNSIKIEMPGLRHFSMTLRWQFIEETQHLGNAGLIEFVDTPAAKKGEYLTFVKDNPFPNKLPSYGFIFDPIPESKDFVIVHQLSATRYRKILVRGMRHSNYVYDSKSVTKTPQDALAEEDESGFLIPLHQPTVSKMSLSQRAQLSSCNTYIVINSYQTVTTKWYEKSIFKAILVIAAVAFSIYTAGGSLAATAGILGTNAAVGLMVGATAATAAIVGAAVNAVAAIILSKLITSASTAIFGEKAGQIVAIIATTVAMAYGASYASTGTFSVDWGAMMQVDNLMKLTSAISNGVTNIMTMETQELADEVEAAAAEYEEQSAKIEELSRDVLGMTTSGIDSMILMNAEEYFVESSESFMARTLMTGDDIIELSIAMIEDFAAISLDLPLAPT